MLLSLLFCAHFKSRSGEIIQRTPGDTGASGGSGEHTPSEQKLQLQAVNRHYNNNRRLPQPIKQADTWCQIRGKHLKQVDMQRNNPIHSVNTQISRPIVHFHDKSTAMIQRHMGREILRILTDDARITRHVESLLFLAITVGLTSDIVKGL